MDSSPLTQLLDSQHGSDGDDLPGPLEKFGMSRRRAGLWQMDEESEARPHRPLVKEKGDGVERWHAFRPGFATNLHEMGVPTKVTKRVCRHADEEALHPRRGTDVR